MQALHLDNGSIVVHYGHLQDDVNGHSHHIVVGPEAAPGQPLQLGGVEGGGVLGHVEQALGGGDPEGHGSVGQAAPRGRAAPDDSVHPVHFSV